MGCASSSPLVNDDDDDDVVQRAKDSSSSPVVDETKSATTKEKKNGASFSTRSPLKPPRSPQASPGGSVHKEEQFDGGGAKKEKKKSHAKNAAKVETSKLSFTFKREEHDDDDDDNDDNDDKKKRVARKENKSNDNGGSDFRTNNNSSEGGTKSAAKKQQPKLKNFKGLQYQVSESSFEEAAMEEDNADEDEASTMRLLESTQPAMARRTREDELITRDNDNDDEEENEEEIEEEERRIASRSGSLIERFNNASATATMTTDDYIGAQNSMNAECRNVESNFQHPPRSKTPDLALTVDKRVNSVTFKKQLRDMLERKSSVKMPSIMTNSSNEAKREQTKRRKASFDSPGSSKPPTTPTSADKQQFRSYYSHTTSMINRSSLSFNDLKFEHSEEDVAFLLKSLRKSVLFADAKEETLRELISVMWKESVEENYAVVTQGEKGNALFLVAEGEFDVFERVTKTTTTTALVNNKNDNDSKSSSPPAAKAPLGKSRLGRRSRSSTKSDDGKDEGKDEGKDDAQEDEEDEAEVRKRLSLERESNQEATSSRQIKNNLVAVSSETSISEKITTITAQEVVEVKVNVKKPGDIFGELALMYGAPRSATVRASERSETKAWSTWVLPRRAFRAVAKRAAEDFRESIAVFMSLVPVFAPLSVAERLRLADAMEEIEFEPDEVILKQGENAGDNSGFYIIVSGEALVYVNDDDTPVIDDSDEDDDSKLGILVNHLFRSNFFGEKALLFDKPRDATVKVGPNAPLRCLKLKRVDFVAMMGTLQDLLSRRNSVTQKRNSKKLKISSPRSEEKKKKSPHSNDTFANSDEPETLEGSDDDTEISSATTAFGDTDDSQKKSPIKTFQGILRIRRVGMGSRNLYYDAYNPADESSIYRDVDAIGTFNESFVQSITSGSFNASMQPFIFTVSEGALIGGGAVGCVNECNHYDTQQKFAIKRVRKVAVKSSPEHVLSERKIVAELNHPSIISLHGAFQSDRHLYFLIDLMNGFDLMDALVSVATVRKMAHTTKPDAPLRKVLVGFDEDAARYYAALIVCAFEYLHELGIIYRDLKPENVFLDKSGRAKLGDFGFAKNIGESGHQTFTFCGTPGYVAPEMVLARGYSYGVDWWALGVLIYVIISGLQPFGQRGQGEKGGDNQPPQNNPLQVMQRIADASFQVTYPIYTSEEGCDLIAGLLQRRVAKRLGNLKGGAQAIKNHPWFENFDWDALENGTYPPPQLPEPSSAILASHTARLAEIEKMVLEQEMRDDEKGENDPKLLAAREIFKDW
jgi:serine/threonine protein kinase/CRP-like cAMP-binding protein